LLWGHYLNICWISFSHHAKVKKRSWDTKLTINTRPHCLQCIYNLINISLWCTNEFC
jgi:hypothetical protein